MLYCRILGQVGENFIPLVPDAPSEEFAHIPEINHKQFSITTKVVAVSSYSRGVVDVLVANPQISIPFGCVLRRLCII